MTHLWYGTPLLVVLLLALSTPAALHAADPPADSSLTAETASSPDPLPRFADRVRRAAGPWDDRVHRHVGAFAGDLSEQWPFRRERALYPSAPAVRYNRVEGLVLGVQRPPMRWNAGDDHRLYGQLGYAFALKQLRYAAGFELRADEARADRYGLKLGALYRRTTATNDDWKTSWLENSLAAGLSKNDFFDYYEPVLIFYFGLRAAPLGWGRRSCLWCKLSPISARSPGYEPRLWSNFRLSGPRSRYQTKTQTGSTRCRAGRSTPRSAWAATPNSPPASAPTTTAASSKRPRGPCLLGADLRRTRPSTPATTTRSWLCWKAGASPTTTLPRAAVRLEAEFGNGLGNPRPYNRYQADGRAYLPVTPFSTLGLRLRGGYATHQAPVQKQFSIGGIGSVRSFPQNAFTGSRTLLGNAEYIVDDVALFEDAFEDLTLIGFLDAGWVGDTGDRFSMDDVLPSAGFGIGFSDRAFRVDVSWPLRNIGGDMGPSVWLRLSPTF